MAARKREAGTADKFRARQGEARRKVEQGEPVRQAERRE